MEHSKLLTVKEGSSYFWKDGRIFFWLGDTAWLMFHKLKWEEINTYLMNRAEKGFNVIQTVAVHHFPAVNAYGQPAFADDDWRRPLSGGSNGDCQRPLAGGPDWNGYWPLVDWTIKRAGELGLYVALLPHWGNLSDHTNLEDMETYVEFLADRYGAEENVIWMTGGDIRGDDRPDYWKAMGSLLRRRCPNRRITFHPFGRTSSADFFPEEPWMDFHLFQSGHRRYDQQRLDRWDDTSADGRYYGEDNWRYVRDARRLPRLLPVLDGEPSYEHIPQGLHMENEPYWTPEQVRRYGWWSVLSGAAGFTYGHNSIMQFYESGTTGAFFVKYPWKDALHAPGCASVSLMGKFMQEIFDELINRAMADRRCGTHMEGDGNTQMPAQYVQGLCGPCESILSGGSAWKAGDGEARIMAFRAGEYILCYTYTGAPICLALDADYSWRAWWMDPESGVRSFAGTVEGSGEGRALTFTPPAGDFTHRDWLLILKKSKTFN